MVNPREEKSFTSMIDINERGQSLTLDIDYYQYAL